VQLLFKRYFELAFWVASLVALAVMDPATDVHYSFCFFRFIGINFCPGCGLGHAISFLFHGDIPASFSAHPLGIFALMIILFRIYKLSFLRFFSKPKNNHYAI
jgi:hypothetical protein